jgi:pimeloyl-ACP methyl ester carboxylesterase
VRLLLRVAFYGGVLFFGLPAVFSELLLRPGRQACHPHPTGVDEVWIQSEGLRLRGWLFRGDPLKVPALVTHGFGDSIESYEEVGWTLRRLGHTVLILELRAHGCSGGRYSTLGGREREDVRAGMAYLEGSGPPSRGLILMGTSLGAVAALRAAAGRSDVRAVVAEAPFDSYRNTVTHHAWLLYRVPRWAPIIPMAIALAEWRADFDADAVDAVAGARFVRAPTLVIADGADPRMPAPVVRRVYDALPGPKRLWTAIGADHAGASANRQYWDVVTAFLEEFVDRPSAG